MFGDESGGESFEDTVRSIAAALGRYIERSFDHVDPGELADFTGVDPAAAREWAETAAQWVSDQTQGLGERLAREVEQRGRSVARVDPLGGAGPHPPIRSNAAPIQFRRL